MVPSNFIEKVMDEEGVAGKESGWVGLGNCSMVSVWDLWLVLGVDVCLKMDPLF